MHSRILLVPLALSLLVLSAAVSSAAAIDAGSAEKESSILSVTPIPPPREGKPGRLGVNIRSQWMEDGSFELRFPETLNTHLGLLFIDHFRSDMIPVVKLDEFPTWAKDETGAVSYIASLPNKVRFSGKITPGPDYVDMLFTVFNDTDQPLHNNHVQVCLSMRNATGFNKQEDVSTTHIPVDGKFIPLNTTHPSAEELGLPPWLQIATKGRTIPEKFRRHTKAGWWFIDEQADHALIARLTDDGKHLVAIAFRDAQQLMTNSRIPCLHSGPPTIPVIGPGESKSISGRMYLMDADLDKLMERYKKDILGEK
jgi:hypothetical protein